MAIEILCKLKEKAETNLVRGDDNEYSLKGKR